MAPVTIFGGRCPVGGCSKKGSLFTKHLSEEECRQAIKTHLVQSPYHEQDEVNAGTLAAAADLEIWDDDGASWTSDDRDACC